MTEEYRLSMGPVQTPGRGETSGWRNRAFFGSQWRATRINDWGPPCFHSSPEAAIDCLDKRISDIFKP
jgi:hypothetical protein